MLKNLVDGVVVGIQAGRKLAALPMTPKTSRIDGNSDALFDRAHMYINFAPKATIAVDNNVIP